MYLKKGAVFLMIGAIVWTLSDLYTLYQINSQLNEYHYYGDPDYSILYLQMFRTLGSIAVVVFAGYLLKHADEPAAPVTNIGAASDGETYV